MKYLVFIILFLLALTSNAQIVSLQPTSAGADDEVILVFDASQGNAELKDASKVYLHHGVVTNSETGTDWKYVIGNWGQDDGVGEMTRVSGETNKWQITFTPTLREYFGVPSNENIFRISAVFRSADGNTKGTITPGTYGWGTVSSGGDFFINLNTSNYISITSPFKTETYLKAGEKLNIEAVASANVSSMKLYVNEGSGYIQKASVTSGKTIAYSYQAAVSVDLGIKVEAVINGETISREKSHSIVVLQETQVLDLPVGLQAGINYHSDDATKVTLVLEAPGKDYVYVVGDFSVWKTLDQNQMKRTPDGEFFWLELDQLIPGKEYVFQYWIDGEIKVGDPYADQVADPWNDKYIPESVYPNIPEYTATDYGIATVLQTGQDAYNWSSTETAWERPSVENLTIYELHVRDFVSSHSYADLTDTLDYLKRLGVDAIELMPINEFEGNDSWGYNPSYYFAPDKYYGTKEALKKFVEKAHEMGMAVILDMVLNHAYGSNAMVKMYWDAINNRPAADNPWFNAEYVGPYQWGYDFNHESAYTKRFVDRVNKYWLEEFHFDGFRFDFTKGFTNYAPGGNVDGFDQSRINILERMADQIWTVDPSAYVILEHWGLLTEETILGKYGLKMWANRSYDFVPAATGVTTGTFASINDTFDAFHVSYFDSHDEQRIAESALTEGLANGFYDVKNPLIMYERMKMIAAFAFLQPGPRMIWQFDELGYDIDIDFNGRIGTKPLPWGSDGLGYYEDENRQYIYDAYQSILKVRKTITPELLAIASTNHKNTGAARRLSYNTSGIDLVVIGNFGLTTQTIDPAFPQTGTWYDYFSGEEVSISNVNSTMELKAGEWHIYTTERLSNALPGVVEVFDSPVTISPSQFNMNDEITITFDATKAWKDGTAGLLDASEVKIVAGVITDDPNSTEWSHQMSGIMTLKGNNIWEITFSPIEFFATSSAFKIGMYFTDRNEQNIGKGFRNSIIYTNVLSMVPIVNIDPSAFKVNEEITLTFNAQQGDRNLMGASKVYMHSGVGTVKTDNPASTAWNYVVGNWGQDDGVGEMTETENDIWEITFVPQSYYGLADSDIPYWLACVFRSADGNIKGSGTPGVFETGIISSGGDIFIQNQLKTSLDDNAFLKGSVYPNPTTGNLYFRDIENATGVKLFNTFGQLVFDQNLTNEKIINIKQLKNGMYIYQVKTSSGVINGRILKQ
ncbi:MAG: alpha-amylase family glycosyl hydrolase [Prolixibacteraceae bacterium]